MLWAIDIIETGTYERAITVTVEAPDEQAAIDAAVVGGCEFRDYEVFDVEYDIEESRIEEVRHA